MFLGVGLGLVWLGLVLFGLSTTRSSGTCFLRAYFFSGGGMRREIWLICAAVVLNNLEIVYRFRTSPVLMPPSPSRVFFSSVAALALHHPLPGTLSASLLRLEAMRWPVEA